ncbi:MAG: cystathionine gamma-synthase [Actinobacteria bacterium]|nr:cystathionine gamma-synthase [Actinomycetota bacterium]
MVEQNPLRPETQVVQQGRPEREPGGAIIGGISVSTTFRAGGEYIYGRSDNDTWKDLEAVLGALEGGQALVFSSGMAAISATFDLIPPGGVVVAPTAGYMNTFVQLRKLEANNRLRIRWVDINENQSVIAALDGAAMLFFESPVNPLLTIADVSTLIHEAKARGVLVAVDNTFATPLRQQPLKLGADVAVHSLTKALSGHSDVVLGAAITDSAELFEKLMSYRKDSGANAGPFEAWLALRGLRTFPIRFAQAENSTKILVERLQNHPAVERVRYPGFGFLVSIEVKGGARAADKACNASRIWSYATSLGGVESLWERRRRHGDEPLEVPENLIRISVGIEHVEDLWSDMDQALTKSQS